MLRVVPVGKACPIVGDAQDITLGRSQGLHCTIGHGLSLSVAEGNVGK